ncbi:LOW QUALITY PROTEIN: acetyltransferase [Purpureocillium lavendulum]|uniref:Acetyltransferase n=1 Tax=Purpureocillium lavendulum TaxID=1247861 RepID=A0AB34FFG0_9HYPO|nr:LOW QUALITY PROTEIN: acetyltransferase [Purpureocillium lavendulum]
MASTAKHAIQTDVLFLLLSIRLGLLLVNLVLFLLFLLVAPLLLLLLRLLRLPVPVLCADGRGREAVQPAERPHALEPGLGARLPGAVHGRLLGVDVDAHLVVDARQVAGVVALAQRVVRGAVVVRPELVLGVVGVRVQPLLAAERLHLVLERAVLPHHGASVAAHGAPDAKVHEVRRRGLARRGVDGRELGVQAVGGRGAALATHAQRAQPERVDGQALVQPRLELVDAVVRHAHVLHHVVVAEPALVQRAVHDARVHVPVQQEARHAVEGRQEVVEGVPRHPEPAAVVAEEVVLERDGVDDDHFLLLLLLLRLRLRLRPRTLLPVLLLLLAKRLEHVARANVEPRVVAPREPARLGLLTSRRLPVRLIGEVADAHDGLVHGEDNAVNVVVLGPGARLANGADRLGRAPGQRVRQADVLLGGAELDLEQGDDAEGAKGRGGAPEEVLLARLGGALDGAVGGDDLDGAHGGVEGARNELLSPEVPEKPPPTVMPGSSMTTGGTSPRGSVARTSASMGTLGSTRAHPVQPARVDGVVGAPRRVSRAVGRAVVDAERLLPRVEGLDLLGDARHGGVVRVHGDGGHAGDGRGGVVMVVVLVVLFRNVHARRRREPEALGHLGQVQLVHVVDGPQAVAGVRVQVVVLADQLLELRLHVQDLLARKVEFHHGHARRLEVRQEPDLVGLQEHEAAALAISASRRSAHSVDVVARVVRRVELDDEVDGGDLRNVSNGMRCDTIGGQSHIKTTGGDIRADQNTMRRVAELEERVGALLLLLLAVQVQHRAVDVVEELGVVLDRVAAAEEDDDLLLLGLHALQEREEEDEPFVGLAQHVALLEALDGAVLLLLVHVDTRGARLAHTDFGRLRGGEEHRLAVVVLQDLDNLSDLILETDFQYPVGLVDDERLEVLEDEGGVEEVVEQAAGRGNQQVHALGQLLRLGLAVGAADDDAVRLRVVLHELAGDAEDLQRELAGRGDDDDAGAVAGLESQGAEDLDGGDQEGERLSGTGLGRTEDVLAGEQRGMAWRERGRIRREDAVGLEVGAVFLVVGRLGLVVIFAVDILGDVVLLVLLCFLLVGRLLLGLDLWRRSLHFLGLLGCGGGVNGSVDAIALALLGGGEVTHDVYACARRS